MSFRTIALRACILGLALFRTASAEPIDRHALVIRHNITVHTADPFGTMAVGNGDFAYNFDITGTQTFPEYYEKTMPVGILTDWAWHHFPNPEGFSFDTFKMKTIPKHDRQFVYPASGTNHPTTQAAYLRGNPNRFGLGRIGMEMTRADGSKADIKDLQQIEQKLDLWSGLRWPARPRADGGTSRSR
jgi:hypothetical protein